MSQGPRRAIAPARLTTAVAITVEAACTTRGPRRAITPARRTTAVAAIAEEARTTRDQRRAITPARHTTAGDTGRVLPLAALVLTTVAAAIKAAAARIRAGAVVAQSQKTCTVDLTISALRRHQLDHVLAGFPISGTGLPAEALYISQSNATPIVEAQMQPRGGNAHERGEVTPIPVGSRAAAIAGFFSPSFATLSFVPDYLIDAGKE